MCRTLLQIDDEPAISVALEIRLQAAGFRTISAPDGPSGLAAAAEHRPDAILLDIRMPGMDGFEVCRRLKADPVTSCIPVIFLSANAPGSARSEATKVGGAACVAKPYEAADLLKTIESVLAAHSGSVDATPTNTARPGAP